VKLKLVDKKQEDNNIYTFTFQPNKSASWQPGQYLQIKLDHSNPDQRGVDRWFTIASAPHENLVKITTRYAEVQKSTFKQALQKLLIGETVEAEEPEGDFVIEDLSKKYILIAGGIGITPYYAILKQLEFEGKSINADLIYISRDKSLIFIDEFNSMHKKNSAFCIHPYPGDKRLTDEELKGIKDLENAVVYISGPKTMVGYYRDKLQELGLRGDQLKVDFFPGYQNA
jgi:ferredoxin-NADP reductase